MSYPVYYVPAGDVLPIFFDSFDGGTGASITLTGLAVTDIEIYKDGSATQRASDAGYTLLDTDGIDFDTITGIHGFSIDTGDNTDAGFYTVGAWFHVVVSAVTIDAQTVNFVAAAFRIMAAEGVAGVPDVNVTHVGDTAQTAGDIIGDTNDIQSKIGTPAGASVSADIAAIEGQTDDIGAAGAGLTAVPWNAAWDAEVQSEVDDALVAQRLDELVNADSDIDGLAPPTVGSVVHELLTKTAGSFTYDQTSDSLEALRDNLATAAALTTVQADTDDIQSKIGTPAGASMSADIAAVKVDTAAILDDTGTAGVVVAAASKTGYQLSATGVDDILDEAVEGTRTLRQLLRGFASALLAKISGAATATNTFRDIDDTKARITATVDADGNRTAITLDLT